MNYRTIFGLDEEPAERLTERLAALVPQHPVLAHAAVTCDLAHLNNLIVAFTPAATDAAVTAVLPVIEDAVARVSDHGHLYSVDIILRANGDASWPSRSRLIH